MELAFKKSYDLPSLATLYLRNKVFLNMAFANILYLQLYEGLYGSWTN